MPDLGERSLKQLFAFNNSFWGSVSRDPSVPQSVKTMIYQHLIGSWIPGNLAVVISPLNEGLEHFLMQPAFTLDGLQYHYPSLNFWRAHASMAHPPDGQNCDPAMHTEFLTSTGQSSEFIYAVVLKSGDVKIEDAAGFERECSYWNAGKG